MEVVEIPRGSFCMGIDDPFEHYAEPIHRVTISYTIYMGKYEVTQAQWQAVMGNNPSEFKNCGGNCPVERVSWGDAQAFIKRLNARSDGFAYRLPSESEWEYAARAGTTEGSYWPGAQAACQYANGPDETARAKYADWTVFNCRDGYAETSPVGTFQPNNFGLFDMAGNVDEWCQDWWHVNYKGAPSDGSAWLSGFPQYRIHRGGSWYGYTFALAPSYRANATPDTRSKTLGFRVVAAVRT